MGMVLSFVPRAAASSRPQPSAGTPAAVIIFPGVRYERPRIGEARPGGNGPDKPISPRPLPHH